MSSPKTALNEQIFEEASTWFVTFRVDDPGAMARQEFRDWLRCSPEHIRAYLEIAATYADMPAPGDGRTPQDWLELANCVSDSNVVELNPRSASEDSSKLGPSRDRRVRMGQGRLLAACVLIVACAAGWLLFDRDTYSTGVGEQRSVTLSDGSIVELNAESKVRVMYRDGHRDVRLLTGQALFRVAKDPSRPFVVQAGNTRVRAVGTQFDVYRRSASTIVTVIEGRVAVQSEAVSGAPASAEPTAALVAAGEQVTVATNRLRMAVKPNVAAATAWTQHQLVFDATPLAEVIAEFARYTPRRIVVDSPSLAALEISGQYTSSSPDSLLRFLSLQKGVTITQVNGETHIRQE